MLNAAKSNPVILWRAFTEIIDNCATPALSRVTLAARDGVGGDMSKGSPDDGGAEDAAVLDLLAPGTPGSTTPPRRSASALDPPREPPADPLQGQEESAPPVAESPTRTAVV